MKTIINKILKTPIYYGCILFCLLLLITFMSVGCEKPAETIKDNDGERNLSLSNQSGISVWKCTPKPNITITLTIDSLQSKIYSNTSPEDILLCLFNKNWTKTYIMNGDTFLLEPSFLSEEGYLKIMHSPDTMELHFLGLLPAQPDYIRDYLFIRQTIQN